ncbi:MAG: undecaprenyldiphospho-muramoylpentapeptide beta-N-acetylglucosaminyltransferase [Candidatus Omnitrophota bacterium]
MRILIVAGGTGGHILPAVTLSQEILSRGMGRVLFVASSKKRDRVLLADKGIDFKIVPVGPLKSRGILAALDFTIRLFAGTIISAFILLRYRPRVVIGFGGYVSGPIVLLASLFGIRTIIHEQNVYPGKANRILARFVDKVAVSFDETKNYLKEFESKIIVSGNPIRKALKRDGRKDAGPGFTLLVIGGSQGAHRLNELVPKAMGLMSKDKRSELSVIHISGEEDMAAVAGKYKEMGVDSRVFSFTEDMAAIYNKCDFVIGRAGAMMVSELIELAIPSILIPYPHAGGHQLANARVLGDKRGAIVLKEEGLDETVLKDALLSMMDSNALEDMALKIKGIKRFDACGVLIKSIS